MYPNQDNGLISAAQKIFFASPAINIFAYLLTILQ